MLFASKAKQLIVVLIPTETVLDEFRRPMTIKGRTAEFYNGRYETSDPTEIQLLLNHKQYGIEFHAVEDGLLEKRNHDIKIIEGAVGADKAVRSIDAPITEDPPIQQADGKEALKTEILSAVETKLSSFMTNILSALDTLPKPEPKAKRVFKCSICNEVFPTGIALGRHRKERHVEEQHTEVSSN